MEDEFPPGPSAVVGASPLPSPQEPGSREIKGVDGTLERWRPPSDDSTLDRIGRGVRAVRYVARGAGCRQELRRIGEVNAWLAVPVCRCDRRRYWRTGREGSSRRRISRDDGDVESSGRQPTPPNEPLVVAAFDENGGILLLSPGSSWVVKAPAGPLSRVEPFPLPSNPAPVAS